MIYEIRKIETVKGTDLNYVVVEFWNSQEDLDAGQPPILRNDFMMRLTPSFQRKVRNAQGNFIRENGTVLTRTAYEALTPLQQAAVVFQLETVQLFPKDQIIKNIESYWARAQARKDVGDFTADGIDGRTRDGKVVPRTSSRPIPTDTTDPKGILAQPEIKDMIKPARIRRPGAEQ